MEYFKGLIFRFRYKELRYSYLPLFIMIVFNLIVFYGTRLITSGGNHFDITTEFDAQIPFIPQMIFVYILAYVQWALCFVVILGDSEGVCHKVYTSEIVAKFIAMVFFILLPTVMARPEVSGGAPSSFLLRFIYSVDTPDNLFPSLHCLESWCCFRGLVMIKHKFKHHTLICFINYLFTMLVFFSVLAVKQHVILDVVGGVAVMELGFAITNAFKADKGMKKLSDALTKRLFKKKAKV